MKIDRGGAFTEDLFREDKLEYWKKKWFGREENPVFVYKNKDGYPNKEKPQTSTCMDAFFWSDGDISLIIDNEKELDSISLEKLEKDYVLPKKEEAKI